MTEFNEGLGIWQILNSNLVTDIISTSGFDLIIFDLEHGLHNTETIQNCLYTAKLASLFTIARIPTHQYQNLVPVIDTGIDGILFPHIETKYELEKAIEQTFCYPDGKKSFSPFVPKYKYGSNTEEINNPMLGILIESKVGISYSKNLIQNPNVDFVYFGAYDLSVELNKPGDIFDDDVVKNLKFITETAKECNKKVLSIYRNNNELETLTDLGVQFPIASVDTSQFFLKLKHEYSQYLKIKKLDY